MVGGIKRCILGCCGADGQRFFALPTKFAEQPSHRWRPSKATQHVPQPSESSLTRWIHAVDACLVAQRDTASRQGFVDAGVCDAQSLNNRSIDCRTTAVT